MNKYQDLIPAHSGDSCTHFPSATPHRLEQETLPFPSRATIKLHPLPLNDLGRQFFFEPKQFGSKKFDPKN